MPEDSSGFTRREFFKVTGAAGMASVVAPVEKLARASQEPVKEGLRQVPLRAFGNTGEMVSALGLGGSQDLMSKLMLLKQAVAMGVTYWDTAHSYEGGNSEKAIGKYFTKYPEDRQTIFLVTKSYAADPQQLARNLDTSLKRMNTSYVDLFFIHHTSNPKADLTPDVKRWAEDAKANGVIRYFGFSTHANMAQCMLAAADMGWVDGIMASYNYRLMHEPEMIKAVAACKAAGIGLVAMKTQARFMSYFSADTAKKDAAIETLADHFMRKGFTPEQAKLKAVWENPAIASICSEMTNMTILQANAAAALDRTRWSRQDDQVLRTYARATAYVYCAGCCGLCASATDAEVPISDILRCLMYDGAYGKHALAQKTFDEVLPPPQIHQLNRDFKTAERRCPQKIPINRLMKAARKRFC